MSRNKSKEERKWKQWKEHEEDLLRQYGMDEETIHLLRCTDWETFKSERRYWEHQLQSSSPELLEQLAAKQIEPDIEDIEHLLDELEDEKRLLILLETDTITLQILLWKIMGYSVVEIADKLGMNEGAIYMRINCLRKKIKKIS